MPGRSGSPARWCCGKDRRVRWSVAKQETPLPSSRKTVASVWPELPFAAWSDTCATLHLWMQVVGKIRLAATPLVNHWWNVTLYVTARGLTTSAMPHRGGAFEISFDFID